MRGRLALSNYVDYVCHSHLTEISFGYYWCSFHISRKAAMVTGCCTIRDLASVMNCIINCWKRYTDGCGKGSHSGNRWRCWYLVLRKYVIGYPPDVFFVSTLYDIDGWLCWITERKLHLVIAPKSPDFAAIMLKFRLLFFFISINSVTPCDNQTYILFTSQRKNWCQK